MNASSVILLSFFTSALTSAGVYYLAERLLPQQAVAAAPAEVVVPSLVGLTEADARSNLAAAGLSLLVGGREASPDAADGAILRQSLPPGTRVREQQPVSVVLAEALPSVPDVVGKPLAAATTAIEEAGFSVQVAPPVPHATVELGSVTAQQPTSGTKLKKERTVTLTPSAGPGDAPIPKLVGLTLASAKVNIQDAGFKLGKVSWVELAERQSYLVVRQEPKADEVAKPGTEVDLVVNRGD